MTRIEIKQFDVCFDNRCCWIEDRTIKGNEDERRITGYYTDIANCLADFVITAKGRKGKTEVKKVLEDIADAEKIALTAIKKAHDKNNRK